MNQDRQLILNEIVEFCKQKLNSNITPNLVFVCTHNSRRSQFSQFWAKYYIDKLNLDIKVFSAGTETTACNERTIASISRSGFNSEFKSSENPKYNFEFKNGSKLSLYSKTVSDPSLPKSDFAAVMTCSHADENCPFIPGCDKRIPLNYLDPKEFDNTNKEEQAYDERSIQIKQEMEFVFNLLKQKSH
jgi:arsenate reductase (thioredoxin)